MSGIECPANIWTHVQQSLVKVELHWARTVTQARCIHLRTQIYILNTRHLPDCMAHVSIFMVKRLVCSYAHFWEAGLSLASLPILYLLRSSTAFIYTPPCLAKVAGTRSICISVSSRRGYSNLLLSLCLVLPLGLEDGLEDRLEDGLMTA